MTHSHITSSIKDQSQELDGTSTIDWNTIPWVRSTLLNDRAVELSTAKVYFFSDSVLLSWNVLENAKLSVSRSLQNIVNWTVLMENQSCSSRFFPGHTTLELHQEVRRTMYNNIDWRKSGNKEVCMANSSDGAAYATRFLPGQWSFFGPGSERNMVRNAYSQTKRFVERCG